MNVYSLGIDLVHDNVEVSLLTEIEIYRNAQERLKSVQSKANTQLRNMRAAQHELETDIQSKEGALGIDNLCHQLNNFSRGINYYGGIEKYDNTYKTLLNPRLKILFQNVLFVFSAFLPQGSGQKTAIELWNTRKAKEEKPRSFDQTSIIWSICAQQKSGTLGVTRITRLRGGLQMFWKRRAGCKCICIR